MAEKIEATYIVTRVRDLAADPPIMPKSISFTHSRPIKMGATTLCRTVVNIGLGYYDPQATYVISEVIPSENHVSTWQFSNDRFYSQS